MTTVQMKNLCRVWKRKVLRKFFFKSLIPLYVRIIYKFSFVLYSIDDILADSDSDLPDDMDEDMDDSSDKTKTKKQRNTFIREDPEDIVDLADIKSIGNVLSKFCRKKKDAL